MARLDVSGMEEIISGFDALSELPDEVANAILTEQADAVISEIRRTGEAMGVHRTGQTLDSLKSTGVKKTKNGHEVKVEFAGKNRAGEKNVTVAFINEYGKTNQPARPFVSTAVEAVEPRTMEIAQKKVEQFLKQKGL